MTTSHLPALAQPLIFEPLFMERVWGGRRLEQLYHKNLPPGARIGESWEVVDREDAQSVVHTGPLRGQTLHELWQSRREEIFGSGLPDSPRFPLLVKMLDAQEKLSIQVHPPAALAKTLGSEPKTEMWYLAHTEAGAELYVGLTEATDRIRFEQAVHEGHAADFIQRLPAETGDSVFIPSGRVHAIGAGCLMVEIQQNSDTTYRVFDWNRMGFDGRPRQLHVDQSLQSIDFEDVKPSLKPPVDGPATLAECEFFRVEKWPLTAPRAALEGTNGRFAIFACLEGEVDCAGAVFKPGDFFLAPACLPNAEVKPLTPEACVLRSIIP